MSSTARSIGCVACGGQFEIASPEAWVVCPYCRQRQALPPELLRELGEFRERFRPEQQRADQAVQHSSAWREIGWAIVGRRNTRRKARREQLEAELAELAVRHHGRFRTDVRDCVAWLDRYWAGPRPIRLIGNWYFVVSGSAGGHPVLAELNLEGLHYESATVEVLLSAWIPGVSDTAEEGVAPSGVHQPFHEGLHQSGYSLEIRGAGLVAKRVLDGAAAARFERDPSSVAELEGIFRELAEVARQRRARTAQPSVEARQVI